MRDRMCAKSDMGRGPTSQSQMRQAREYTVREAQHTSAVNCRNVMNQ